MSAPALLGNGQLSAAGGDGAVPGGGGGGGGRVALQWVDGTSVNSSVVPPHQTSRGSLWVGDTVVEAGRGAARTPSNPGGLVGVNGSVHTYPTCDVRARVPACARARLRSPSPRHAGGRGGGHV